MMNTSLELTGRLIHLRQRFVHTMPNRIAAIAGTLAECVEWGTEETDRLERQFHTLGGTAGTYDLHAVAAAAFEGEEACAAFKQSPLDAENMKYLGFLVDQLAVALATDAPAQWTARTVLMAADGQDAALEQTGVSAA